MLHVLRASLVLLLAVPFAAHARDPGNIYKNAPYSKWYKAQRNCGGGDCCGEADARNYYDGYTLNPDGSVTLADQRHIPACDVMMKPNPTGHAVIWTLGPTIFCFAPGGGF